MAIAFEDVFPVLAEAVSGFMADDCDWEDRLSYPFISDMVRFVDDRVLLGGPEPKQLSDLLERLLTEGDGNVHDLAVDAVESVWEKENGKLIAEHFGPKTKRIWDDICQRGWVQ